MATFYVQHHLYPQNSNLFVVDVKQVVKLRGESGTDYWRNSAGEHFWEIVIYTSGVDSDEESLGPFWLDMVGTAEDVDELISDKIKEICDSIDWTRSPVHEDLLETQEDRYPPYVCWQYPTDGQTDVSIGSSIILRLREILPAKGIDTSSIRLTVDGFEVTPEVTGNIYDCIVSYKPMIGS